MNKEKLNLALSSIIKAAGYFCIYFLASTVVGFIFSMAYGFSSLTEQELYNKVMGASLEITMISNALAVLGCCLLIKAFRSEPAEALRVNTGFGKKWSVVGSCLFLGLSGQFVITVVLGMIPFPESWIKMLEKNSDMIISSPVLTQVVAVAIVAPLAEEIIFRGCIQRTLGEGMPKWLAIFLASLVFGLMHATPISIIYATVLGALMGWLFVAFDSIIPSVIFHIAFNAMSMLVGEVLVIVFIGACVIFALCIAYLVRLSKLPRTDTENIEFIEGDDNDEAL